MAGELLAQSPMQYQYRASTSEHVLAKAETRLYGNTEFLARAGTCARRSPLDKARIVRRDLQHAAHLYVVRT